MLTKGKDLRTGRPLWFYYSAPSIPYKELTRDASADVIIVGAGISGAMMAEELTSAGFSVIIIDRRSPLQGSTPASTALLQYDLDVPLTKLSQRLGSERAMRIWRRSKLGLDNLVAKIESFEIECDLQRKQTLYLSGNILNMKQLRKENEVRNQIGLYNEYLSSKILKQKFKIKNRAALLSFDNVAANPRRLAAGFLLKALERGAKIYAPVTAMKVHTKRNLVHVQTEEGHVLKAKHAIFCTGYELLKQLNFKDYKVISTWAIATKRQKIDPHMPLIWEAADPYLYIRSTPDGRIVCGGEDENFSDENERDALLPAKTKILERKLKRLLPHLDTKAEFAWTGSFGNSKNGIPFIGPVRGLPRCWCVVGFGGNGIIFSRIGADIIRASLTGKKDPDEDLFR